MYLRNLLQRKKEMKKWKPDTYIHNIWKWTLCDISPSDKPKRYNFSSKTNKNLLKIQRECIFKKKKKSTTLPY